MSHAATVEEAEAMQSSVPDTATGVQTGKLGIWIFLASEVMFFAGLIGAYVVLRYGLPDWPDPSAELNIPLTAFNTFVLICSSVTMVKALSAAHRDDQTWMKRWLAATVLQGMFFLSVQAYEYHKLVEHGLTPWRDLFGSTFYTLTGFHGAHVTGGVIWLSVITAGAFMGRFSSKNYIPIELAGLYWHFVDLVWIILFTIVYLI